MMGSKGGRECNIILGRAVPERGLGGKGSKGVGWDVGTMKDSTGKPHNMQGSIWGAVQGKIRQYYFEQVRTWHRGWDGRL